MSLGKWAPRVARRELLSRSLRLEPLEQRALLDGAGVGGMTLDHGEMLESISGTGSELARETVVDADGNWYVAGTLLGTADFDPGSGVAELSTDDTTDVFLAKYSAEGELIWAKASGGTCNVSLECLSVDADGHVSMVGQFSGSFDADFGAEEYLLSSSEVADYIVELDGDGSLVNAGQIAPVNSGDRFGSETLYWVGDAGDAYLMVSYWGTVDLDPGTGTQLATAPANQYGQSVVHYDADGSVLWSASYYESYDNDLVTVSGLAVDAAGTVHLVGSFKGTFDADWGDGVASLTSAGSTDGFWLQIDASGEFLWAGQIGGEGQDSINQIAAGSDGSLTLIGGYSEPADLDPGEGVATYEVTEKPYDWGFVLRADASGQVQWIRTLDDRHLRELVVADDGSVYVGGEFVYADFDPSDETFLITSNTQKEFIWKLDDQGDFQWVRTLRGNGYVATFAVFDGYVYVAGWSWGSLYATIDGQSTALTTAGAYDGILARFYDFDAAYGGEVAGGSVNENTASFTVVGTASLVYPDAITTPSVYLTDTVGGTFSILDEEILVSSRTLLDYERYPSFTLTVDVNDTFREGSYYCRYEFGIAEPIVVNVNDVEESPEAVFDRYEFSAGTTLTVSAADGVLANDSDPDGDAITAALVADARYGTVTLNSDGSFTYVPDAGYSGADSFSYCISDGTSLSGTVDVLLIDIPLPQATEYLLQIGGQGNDTSTGLVVDAEGNSYVCGIFSGTIDLAPGTDTYLVTSEQNDQFLAKYSPEGELLWVSTIPAAFAGLHNSLTLGSDGSLYWAGHFSGTVDVDSGSGTTLLTSAVFADSFLIQLDTDGNFIRAAQFGGTGNVLIVDLAVRDNGEVYLTVDVIAGSADLDPSEGEYTVSSLDARSSHLVKLDVDWSLEWAWQITDSTSSRMLNDIAVDSAGNVLAAGFFFETINFDAGSDVFSLTSAGSADGFLLKLDANGQFVSAVRVGGEQYDSLTCVAIGADDNPIIGGNFRGVVDLDPGSGVAEHGTAGSTSQCFIASLDAENNLVWVQSLTGTLDSLIATDDGVYAANAANASSSNDYDSSDLLCNIQGSAGVVWKLDADGNLQWARSLRSARAVDAFALYLSNGYLYVTGTSLQALEATINTQLVTLAAQGGTDIFLARLSDDDPIQLCTNLVTVPEDASSGTLVGTIFATYPDQQSSLTMTLSGDYSGWFTVSGHEIRVASGAEFDYETASTCTVIVAFSEAFYIGGSGMWSYTFTRSVTIQIGDVNESPEAVADTYTLDQYSSLTVPAETGLLANDLDPENQHLCALVKKNPEHGTLTLNQHDGSFVYVPKRDYTGTDTFWYQAFDGTLLSDAIQVTLTIAPVVDRGLVSYDEQSGLVPADGMLRFRYSPHLAGWITFEDPAADGTIVEVYNTNLELLATLDGARFDKKVIHGEKFLVHVIGDSTNASFRYMNLVSQNGDVLNVLGTDGDDLFDVAIGSAAHQVTVKGLAYTFAADSVGSIVFDGGLGTDTASVAGTKADEQVTMAPGSATFSGGGLTVTITSAESITVTSGGGADTADLYDSADGIDTFTGTATFGRLVGEDFFNVARGFDLVRAHATSGGGDVARLYGSAGQDIFTASPITATFVGSGFSNTAEGFAEVHAFAEGDADDGAYLTDLADSAETYEGTPTDGRLYNSDPESTYPFFVRASGFSRVSAQSAGGGDTAVLVGSAGDETFSAAGAEADMVGNGFAHHVSGFALTSAVAKGGTDYAQYTGTELYETFTGTYVYGRWAVNAEDGQQYLYRAVRFDRVTATTTTDSNDTARFEDSIYDDVFEAKPYSARMYNSRCDNRAEGFYRINAFSESGGNDTAILAYSSDTDTLIAGPNTTRIYCGEGDETVYYIRAAYFDQVHATNLATAKKASRAGAESPSEESLLADLAATLAASSSRSAEAEDSTAAQDARDGYFALLE